MRTSHVATALAAFTAGLTAAAALRRRADRRRAATPLPVTEGTVTPRTVTAEAVAAPAVPTRDAVVLPFLRLAAPAPVAPAAAPARCGDTGGRTKAGAPCAARASSGGRCHHHPLAA
ncbi:MULTISPECIES: hypothetical protein [unclassified Geodermatophilus]|uniref:hypothetical protein n=1 Tax=unclassified Geodermatophilus TaxID=2637632 RepID=UPI003EEC0CFA